VNNHEGSLATADVKLMAELMPVLKQRILFLWTAEQRGDGGVEAADARECEADPDVPFLDDVADVAAIRKQLEWR